MDDYSQKQLELTRQIEESFKKGQNPSETVKPVSDYVNDDRICLTSVVFLPGDIENEIIRKIINPLREADASQYYYGPGSMHVTINNVRVINNPPHFSDQDIEKAKLVFRKTISKYRRFEVSLKRLFELPTSLAISAFTSNLYQGLVLDLRSSLSAEGIKDDKKYALEDVIIANSTISRFTNIPNREFYDKVKTLKEIEIGSFEVKKICLITTNAVCHPSKTKIVEEYDLI